jgi:hypothetical protein
VNESIDAQLIAFRIACGQLTARHLKAPAGSSLAP